MDLNFLIFPKPEFKGAGTETTDLFYSRLLLVPNRGARLKSINSKPPVSIKDERAQPSDTNLFKIHPDMEGKPLLPRAIVKKSFDFIRGKPPLRFETESIDNSFQDIDSPGILIQPVRAIEKSVRLPKSPILHKDICNYPYPHVSENSPHQKRTPNYINAPQTKKKNGGSASNITLSKLMSDLDSYKLKKPTGIHLKSHIDSKFLLKKLKKEGDSSSKHRDTKLSQMEEMLDDFAAPSEHPICIDKEDDGLNSAVVNTFFQKRSLNQLNKMFPKSGGRLMSELQAPYININIKSSVKSPGPKLMIRSSADKTRINPLTTKKEVDLLDENTNLQSAQSKILTYNKSPFKLSLKGRVKDTDKPALFGFKASKEILRNSSTTVDYNTKVKVQIDAAKIKNLINQGLNEYDSIPCLVCPPKDGSSTVLLYFHANGEDIYQIQGFCEMLQISFQVISISSVLGGSYGIPRLQRV